MGNIKPAEVSKILRQQLDGIKTGVELEEVGTVLEVGDGIARIYGLSNAESNELIEFENGIEAIVLNLEEDNIGAVLLGPTEKISEGDIVKRTGALLPSWAKVLAVIITAKTPDGKADPGGETL
jgi:F-type H+-transporting ATPase subunit alpha